MSNIPIIHNARDYVNYVFNISTRGAAEVTSEIFGLSSTVQNVLGNLAFKTSEYLSHAEATTVGFGIAAAGAYVSATKHAIEFQQATANVEAISGKQLIGSEVGAQAMEMSNKFGIAIEDMTSGLESLARAGVTAKSSIDALLESGTQMAKFEGTDLETSMNDLISTVNLLTSDMDANSEAYAKRVEEVNQHIISTSESSPINAHDIINSLQHVGGYASSTNLDQDDLFAVIAQLGAKGTKGEITGTSLRAFVSAGQKDTAQRALSRIGLSVKDLWDDTGESILSISQMKDVLDDALEAKGYSKQQKLEFYSDFVGYKQANQIMKIDTSEVEHYRGAIDNAMNLTDKMNITLGTVQGNWSRIVNTARNFMTKVGSKLLPIINAILVPIRMIVEFIDNIPFLDWGVAFGLGLVAIEGMAKGIQVLVPTMMTFISKFVDLEKTSFNIRDAFDTVLKDLKDARDVLKSMNNKEEMNKRLNERETINTNKYLHNMNEKDAINEIMRQKFGIKGYHKKTKKPIYWWDTFNFAEQEHHRNKYRPPQELIDKFIEKRQKLFDKRWSMVSSPGARAPNSTMEWPTIDDTGIQFNTYADDYQNSVVQLLQEISDKIESSTDSIEIITPSPSSSTPINIEYNKSNRERNKEDYYYNNNDNTNTNTNTNNNSNNDFNFLKGTISQKKYSKIDNIDAIYNTGASNWQNITTSEVRTKEDVINAISDFFEKGRFESVSPASSMSPSALGATNTALGTIKLDPSNHMSSFLNPTYKEKGESFYATAVHELTHMLLTPDHRSKEGNRVPKGKPLRNADVQSAYPHEVFGYPPTNILGGLSAFGTEAEANLIELIVDKAFDFERTSYDSNYNRLDAFLAALHEEEDVNLDLINPLANEFINNVSEFGPIMMETLKENVRRNNLSDNDLKKNNDLMKEYQKFLDTIQNNEDTLKKFNEEGVKFGELKIFNNNTVDQMNKIKEQGEYWASRSAEVFDLAPSTAAAKIEEEKERIRRKMDEFHNDDVILNSYKKNITTSAMSEEGKEFAIRNNQRQLVDFLNHGLENAAGTSQTVTIPTTGQTQTVYSTNIQDFVKGGLLRGQWEEIQRQFGQAYYTINSSGDKREDTLVRGFAGLTPEQFLNKYNSLTRDADKIRIMNALLKYGQKTASDLIDTRENVNYSRQNLITTADYKNIAKAFNIDFSGASNKKESFEILQNWLKGAGQGRENEVAQILMQHENVLARTMESASVEKNKAFLEFLSNKGYNVADIKFSQNYGRYNLYEELRERFFEKDSNGQYKDDQYQQLVQDSKKFWGEWAEYGQAAQYELGIHFQEIALLAKRAGVNVNDVGGAYRKGQKGVNEDPYPDDMGYEDGRTIFDAFAARERYVEHVQPKVEILTGFVDKIQNIANRLDDKIFGHYEDVGSHVTYNGQSLEGSYYVAGNRFGKKIHDALEPYDGVFAAHVVNWGKKIESVLPALQDWQMALSEVGRIFPPFTIAAHGLGVAITTLTTVTQALILIETTLTNMRKLEGVFSIFKNGGKNMQKIGDKIKMLGELIENSLGAGIEKIAGFALKFAGPLAIVAAAILAVVAALKLSQDAHDKYLEKLKKEQKEIVSEDKANQALYESARKQRRAGYRNKAAKNFGDIQYDVAQQRLHASNLKRQINARKVAEQESDALWGTYGERARLQKMDWGQSIGAYIIPFVGTIAKAMAGEFKSTASEYTGSTEQIRQIKESTINNPRATGSQKMVAAYFDANQAQLSMIDNYKSELGELYDTESKLIRMYGSKESARNSALFKKSVEKFAEKVGIDVETAKKMLDYMQIERNVETASTAMKARADSIVNETEQKALAAANGADMDILLNGKPEEVTKLMVQAQADSIKQQAADSLWWKAVWSSFSAMFWQAVSPLTLIYNILTYIWYGVMALVSAGKNPLGTLLGNNQELNNNLRAMDVSGRNIQNSLGDMIGQGPEAKAARMRWEGYNRIQNEDLYSKGMSSISDLDRANYGNGGGSLSSPNVVPATPKDYQEDTTNTTNTESKTTSQSTSWWDTLFKPQDNTVTQKASTKTASAQTETSKAQAYQQKYDNNLHAIDWYARNSIGDMVGQGPEAKRAQAYQQGYDKIQKVEVTNQDDSVALQTISNEIIGVGAVGLIAKRYNIGGTVGDISSTLKLLSKSNIFTQGVDLIKSIVKHTKNIGTPASSLIKNIAKTLGITGKSGAKALAGKGADVLKDTLEQAAEALDKVEKLNDIKEAYHEHGVKGVLKSGWEKIKGSEKYNKLKDFILGKEVTKPTGRVKVGIDAPNEPIMATTREGGLLSKIKSIPKTLKDINKTEGLKGLYMRGANRVKGLSPYTKAKDFLFGKEVEVPSGRVKVGIDAPNERIMTTTREGGALSKIKGGIQDINVKDLWSRGKTGGKEVLRAASKDVGGWEGLLSTTKSGMIEAMNPKTAVTGLKEMGAGLKGGGTLLKGASKVAGPAAAILGGALTFMEEYEEHDPSKTHYNEDGTEKKAFQSAGEVAGSTVGAAAGGLGGAILGAEAGAALGTAVAGPIGTAVGGIAGGIIGGIVGEETMRQWGDAIGGTLGWVGDQLWNLVPEQGKAAWNTITKFAGDAWNNITSIAGNAWESITGTLSGFGKWLNDATGGVSGQIWDTLVGTNEQSDRLVKGALGYTPIGAGINLASDVYNWLTGSEDNTNTSSYQPQTAEATQKGVEEAQKNKRTQGTKTSIVIENININTEDDPEKIKTALMNLIIELQEQVSPRMVSRTIGEPAQASSDTEEDSKTKEEEEALKKQQSGSSTTTTLS